MEYLLILLTVIFVICKILGAIAWSWWLVLLPAILLGLGYVILWIIAIFIAKSKYK